jgi:hypothetical protein
MPPGAIVIIAPEWRQHYREAGAAVAGIVTEISNDGTVARVRLDEFSDTYILVEHLYQAYPPEMDPDAPFAGDWRILHAIAS